MFSRSTLLACIPVILLSGLSFVFLTGQDYSPQAGLCDPDPCANIPNAVEGTCAEFGGSCTAPSDYFCSCDSGYTWEDVTHTCLEEPPQCVDNDQDGYGNPASTDCAQPELDCDDTNGDVYPDAPELCDGVDNQCPGDPGYGELDEGCGMAQIPAGCFDMGDSFAEGSSNELPVHNVCISAFEMDVHEVTNAEYAECVDDGGCTIPYYTVSYSRATYYGDPVYDYFPVIWVDWYQAVDYCTWAGKRLPTEAEWEYAARGGLAGKRYPWGDTISGSDANYWGSGDPWDNDTSQVEYYAPNGYGLYDMAGNVWEWVNDWYQSDYYSVSPSNDPPGPAGGLFRVLRGGSWYNLAFTLRVAYRNFYYPVDENFGIGFRCAR